MKKHAILSFLIAAVTLLHPSYAIADTLMDDDRKESPTVYPYQLTLSVPNEQENIEPINFLSPWK